MHLYSGVARILCQGGAQVWRREKTENNNCMSDVVPPQAALYTPEYTLVH